VKETFTTSTTSFEYWWKIEIYLRGTRQFSLALIEIEKTQECPLRLLRL